MLTWSTLWWNTSPLLCQAICEKILTQTNGKNICDEPSSDLKSREKTSFQHWRCLNNQDWRNMVKIHTKSTTYPLDFVLTSASAIGKLRVTVAADMKVFTRLLTSSKSARKDNGIVHLKAKNIPQLNESRFSSHSFKTFSDRPKSLLASIKNTIILFVYPSKILHKHRFQFLLGPL